jgi:hypothetical protein
MLLHHHARLRVALLVVPPAQEGALRLRPRGERAKFRSMSSLRCWRASRSAVRRRHRC